MFFSDQRPIFHILFFFTLVLRQVSNRDEKLVYTYVQVLIQQCQNTQIHVKVLHIFQTNYVDQGMFPLKSGGVEL